MPINFQYPNTWCPHYPHPKQRAFLELDCLEAFFGGAAGGGKSQALLMAALQFVDRPGYAALILRRDLQRLALAGGLIPRSHEWLANSNAKWNGNRRQWTFPNDRGPPASLTFGYLSGPFDKYRYASSEYQFLAFDELTEIREEDYLFLFSRLRRVKTLEVPLRVRSASNPGNTGHLWVKRRFIPEETLTAGSWSLAPDSFLKEDRVYIPSRVADNPSLDADEYLATLVHLPPLARERLARGDWSVQEAGQFRPEWLRYYVENVGSSGPEEPVARYGVLTAKDSPSACNSQLELLDSAGALFAVIPPAACRRFATVDPAGTSADVMREERGRAPSHTVVQIWEQPRRAELARFLLLRHQVRERVAFDGFCEIIRDAHRNWQPERIWIENEKFGLAAVSILAPEGLPIEIIRTEGKDKLARASWLTNKMSRGEVFLPRYENSWRLAFEAELLAWTGHDDQPSDQIDAAAYAAIVASRDDHRPIRIERPTGS